MCVGITEFVEEYNNDPLSRYDELPEIPFCATLEEYMSYYELFIDQEYLTDVERQHLRNMDRQRQVQTELFEVLSREYVIELWKNSYFGNDAWPVVELTEDNIQSLSFTSIFKSITEDNAHLLVFISYPSFQFLVHINTYHPIYMGLFDAELVEVARDYSIQY